MAVQKEPMTARKKVAYLEFHLDETKDALTEK